MPNTKFFFSTSAGTLQKIDNIALEYHVGMNDYSPDELVHFLRSSGYDVRTRAPSDEDPEVGYMYATRRADGT